MKQDYSSKISVSKHHVAIIDIGSNSIRLVVYEGLSRVPIVLFNEKAVCALGQGLEETRKLNPEGRKIAIPVILRFCRLAKVMHVRSLNILATSAVRDAKDGIEFVQTIEDLCQIPVTILSGEEEAQLAALGVLCGTPKADGLVADLGGGSLELIALDKGQFSGPYATMPLGVLRLWDASAGGDRVRASKIIDKYFSALNFWSHGKDKTLYCVGGAWRALAKLYISYTKHPLHVIDNFTLKPSQAYQLTSLITQQNQKALDKIPGISRKRVSHMPLAAMLLEKILYAANPQQLVFSVYSVREGQYFRNLPETVRSLDPLLFACAELARNAGRFTSDGEEIFQWMTPLFLDETKRQERLRLATCYLSDLFWNEHPDYRAEHAFLRIFRLSLMGLDHQDRAALALAIYARYGGSDYFPEAHDAIALLSRGEENYWQRLGMALRLGYSISGGAPSLLKLTNLIVEKNNLLLTIPDNDPAFAVDFNERRYEKAVKAIGFQRLEIRKEKMPNI